MKPGDRVELTWPPGVNGLTKRGVVIDEVVRENRVLVQWDSNTTGLPHVTRLRVLSPAEVLAELSTHVERT
jgi:hypothetical protein